MLDEKSDLDMHRCHMAAMFGVFVNGNHDKLPRLQAMDKPIHEREHNDCQQLITKSHGRS